MLLGVLLLTTASCGHKSGHRTILTTQDYVAQHEQAVLTHLSDSIYLSMSKTVVYIVAHDVLAKNPTAILSHNDIVNEYLTQPEKYDAIAQGYDMKQEELLNNKISKNGSTIDNVGDSSARK